MKKTLLSLFDRICFFIAWRLPRRVVYHCYIRLHGEATIRLSNRTPTQISWDEALDIWERDGK